MAEYGYNQAQDLQPGAAALLGNIHPCMRCPQLALHEDMTPSIRLRGIVRNRNCCNPKAVYNVSFSGNIAVAEGGTAGEIQLALSVNGFVRPFTIAAVTPAAAQQFWNVSGGTDIEVAEGCCADVAVVNASTGTTAITVRNLNVKVNRVSA